MADGSVKIKGWKRGMDNIHTAEEIAFDDEGKLTMDMLRDAVNVDVLDAGKIRRRKGFASFVAGKAHSVWSDGDNALVVLDGNLVKINEAGATSVLHANIGERRVQYTDVNGDIYYANGVATGKITAGQHREWGVEVPSTPPGLASTNGSMFAGAYQVACTYVNTYGEESGSGVTRLRAVSTGGLTITTPVATSSEVAACRVYLTQPNGDVFYRVAEVSPGDTVTLSQPPTFGVDLSTLFFRKMIPGELIEYYRGRIYAAVGNILWYSEPYQFGLYNPLRNYIVFPSNIDILKSVTTGLYVVCDRSYWLGGAGPDDFDMKEVLPVGGARYSASNLPNSKDILWYSNRGLIIGSDNGEIKVAQENRVRPDPAETGSTLVREQDSLVQYVGIGRGAPFASPLSASDYWDVEIIRRS